MKEDIKEGAKDVKRDAERAADDIKDAAQKGKAKAEIKHEYESLIWMIHYYSTLNYSSSLILKLILLDNYSNTWLLHNYLC